MPALPRLALLAALLLLSAQAPVEPRRVSNWAADPSFHLLNHGEVPVREVLVLPAGQRERGAERLRRAVPPGRQARIALPAGQCLNDIRVAFADGHAVERRRVDTCALPRLAFP